MSSQSQITDEWTTEGDNSDVPPRPQYTGGNSNTCQNCGNSVTPRFARVFGDNQDVVHRCLDCANFREVQDGAAAGYDSGGDGRGLGLGGDRT